MLFTFYIIILITLISICFYFATKNKSLDYRDSTVLITGGSSGIGLELTDLFLKSDCNVIVCSRNPSVASSKIDRDINQKYRIDELAIDLTKPYEEVKLLLDEYFRKREFPNIIVNCAGISYPSKFIDSSPCEWQKMSELNLMSSLKITHYFLGKLEKLNTKKPKRLCYISSMAGQVGLYGFAAYSASKFSLKGFCDALKMELIHTPEIKITLAYPPDTMTPGYERENLAKPLITQRLSEGGGLAKPDSVANVIKNDVVNGYYYSFYGITGLLLTLATAGMQSSVFYDRLEGKLPKWIILVPSLLVESFFAAIIRLIAMIQSLIWTHQVKSIIKEIEEKKIQ